jgi:hypothetical protein
MKNLIGITALTAFSLTLFSFSTSQVTKANYNEVNTAAFTTLRNVGSFYEYQTSHYSSGEVVWSQRCEIWTLSSSNESLDNLEKTINN